MNRREFLAIAGGAALTQGLFAEKTYAGPSSKRALVVWPSYRLTPMTMYPNAFLEGLRGLGYRDDRDLNFVLKYGDDIFDHLPAVMQETVQLKPDVILAAATLEAVAAKKATSTIPVVCPALADAAHLGLIASEAKPGGNVTGIEPYIAGLPAKQIELARELVPSAKKIGLLTNSEDPKGPPQQKELEAAGREVGIEMIAANAGRTGEEIEDALRRLANEQADVVIVLQTNLLLFSRAEIAALSTALRLPTVYGYREHVLEGGLISYGVDLRWCYRRSAVFVDKILHGTPPGDLPIEFPTSFVLAVNLKTVTALGLTLSPTLRLRADEVIE